MTDIILGNPGSCPTPFACLSGELDLLEELLSSKRSHQTRRAYECDLKDFFRYIAGEYSLSIVQSFFKLNRFAAIALVMKYKANLLEKKLKETTLNRRLAAIKALVNYARQLGLIEWTLVEVREREN